MPQVLLTFDARSATVLNGPSLTATPFNDPPAFELNDLFTVSENSSNFSDLWGPDETPEVDDLTGAVALKVPLKPPKLLTTICEIASTRD